MSVSIESEGRVVEKELRASNHCKAGVDCGFLKFLASRNLYVKENAKGQLLVNCGKIVSECPRPSDSKLLSDPLPRTHEELIRSFPEMPNSNRRKPRRVTGGGHL